MPAPTLVQMKQSAGFTSGSPMAVLSAAPTVGNSVILIIGMGAANAVTSITSPMGTLTFLATLNPTSGYGPAVHIYYCANVTTANANVTLTWSTGYAYPVAYEWPGQISTATNKGAN